MSNNSSFEYNSVLSSSVVNSNRQQNGDAHSSNGMSPGYSYQEMHRYNRNDRNMNGYHSTPIRNTRNGHYRRPYRHNNNNNRSRNDPGEQESSPGLYEHQIYFHDVWRTSRFNPRAYYNRSMVEDPWKDLIESRRRVEEENYISAASNRGEDELVGAVENTDEEIDVSAALCECENELVDSVENEDEEIDISAALDESEDELVGCVEKAVEEIDVSGALDGSDNESDVNENQAIEKEDTNIQSHEEPSVNVTDCSEKSLNEVDPCNSEQNNGSCEKKQGDHDKLKIDRSVKNRTAKSSKDQVDQDVKIIETEEHTTDIGKKVKDCIEKDVKNK